MHIYSSLRIKVANSPAGVARLGMAVPRQVGNAPTRNRIRRWIREAFRLRLDRLPAIDLLVSPRFDCLPDSFAAVERDLDSFMTELGEVQV